MRIISKKTVEDFIKKHPETENPQKAWYQKVSQARWKTPQEVKQEYSKKVSILNNNTRCSSFWLGVRIPTHR